MDTRSFFLELHAGLPRQAPGSDATTRRLLSMCGTPPARPEVLDVGCGPGRATLVLAAELPSARLTAVDLHPPFLDELAAAAARAGLRDRIEPVRASMTDLAFDDGRFDLVWSEGAIYIMGFSAGLRAWRRLVKPRGLVVLTEATWFTDAPSAETAGFWTGYPDMTDVAGNVRRAEDAGYELVGTYALPASDWWDEYYAPLTERLDACDTRDPAVASVVAAQRVEIDLYRDHGDEYGYTGYVLRRAE